MEPNLPACGLLGDAIPALARGVLCGLDLHPGDFRVECCSTRAPRRPAADGGLIQDLATIRFNSSAQFNTTTISFDTTRS